MTAEALRNGPVADAIRRHRLVVILRRVAPRERLLALVAELADAGARVLEITFDAPSAEGDLRTVRDHLETRADGPFLVGAGTITRPDQLEAALRAGARFALAPSLDERLVGEAVAAGLPFIPGAFSPTEIASAWRTGATFVKVFPASAVGPAFVREMRGPLPEIELIPTGGIDGTNAGAFLEAGAVAVGIGGALTRAEPSARAALVQTVTGASRS